jgi:hypothetical protein
VSALTDVDRAAIERDAIGIIRDMLGTGYVPDYYRNLAGPIVGLVEHWAERGGS